MNIIIDYNNDTLTIEIYGNKLTWKIKEPDLILKILEEILTSINYKNLVDYYGVVLKKIDEGTCRTIGEW